MAFRLSDILDLDFLLALDEHPDAAESAEPKAARDRDIFRQAGGDHLSDNALMAAWLSYRKMLYLDQAGPGGYQRLPGRLFNDLFTWTARGLAMAGGLAGLFLAYGFLAYHGVRPVNVAVFFFVFVLLPAVFSLFSVAGFLFRHVRGFGTKSRGMSALVSSLLFDRIPGMLKRLRNKAEKRPAENGPTRLDEALFFIRTKKQAYGDLFFWPLVILVSLFALFFSLGALGGTVFRVAFSDVAFGWQSTLAATPAVVHDLVTLVSMPWATWVPEALTGPTLDQIDGSRIVLKQGIAALATKDLVSWWPFLCLSMVCYAIVPRVLVIGGAVVAQRSVLKQFDLQQPRFRRLMVRMKSPIMDIRVEETASPRQGAAPSSEPIHRSHEPEKKPGTTVSEDERSSCPASDPIEEKTHPAPGKMEPAPSGTGPASVGTPAVVLAPVPAWDQAAADRISLLLAQQFLLDVRQVIYVAQDLEADSRLLGPEVLDGADPVIFLQEVWQPPIRGLLHYLAQLKQGVLRDKNLWILLTQAPEEEILGVDGREVEATVWQDRVLGLNHPDILVERIRP
jgi:hypothetical protein